MIKSYEEFIERVEGRHKKENPEMRVPENHFIALPTIDDPEFKAYSKIYNEEYAKLTDEEKTIVDAYKPRLSTVDDLKVD